MKLNELTAISPADGRYRTQVADLAAFFSEYALIRYRVQVEVEYFIALCAMPLPQFKTVDAQQYEGLRSLYLDFSETDAQRVKEIERVTNHDVKAVEYFLKEAFDRLGLSAYKEFIHFGLTSQDINNTSVPLSIREAMEQVYYPSLTQILERLKRYSDEWKDVALLARTHGQPASPTRLGKEVEVYVSRLEAQIDLLKQVPFSAKFEIGRAHV